MSDTPRLSQRSRLGRVVLKGTFWAVVVFILVQAGREMPGYHEWGQAISRESLPNLLALVLGMIVVISLRGLRWGVMARGEIPVTLPRFVLLYGWYFLLSMMTPFRAGEVARVAYFHRMGGALSRAGCILILERTQDLLILLAMLVAVAGFHHSVPANIQAASLFWMAAVIQGYALALIVGRLQQKSPHNQGVEDQGEHPGAKRAWRQRVRNTVHDVLCYLGDTRTNLKALFLGAASWGTLILAYHMALHAFFPDLSLLPAMFMLAMVNLSGLLNLSPGSIGVYQAATVLALGSFGIPGGEALVAGVVMQATLLLTLVVVGLSSRLLFRES